MMNERSQLHEIQRFDKILQFIDEYDANESLLVIYDLDNTVLTYGHDLGTDQWFEHYLHKRISKGMTPKEAKEYTLKQLTLLAEAITDLKPVEPATPKIIREIQSKGCQSLVLTSRGDYLKQATVNQLEDPSICLSFNTGLFKDLEMSLDIGNGALLANGVAYVSGQHKGHALIEILKKINYFPRKIIFIDDKKHNLEQVQSALATLGQPIELIGLRYSAMDQEVKTLDPKIVRKQLEHFHNKPILSNEEALTLWKLEQKHLKLKLGVKVDLEKDCVTLWGNKKSVYDALIMLDENLSSMKDTPIFGNINGGNDKLCWQFTMNMAQFKALKPSLEHKELLQVNQMEALEDYTPFKRFPN